MQSFLAPELANTPYNSGIIPSEYNLNNVYAAVKARIRKKRWNYKPNFRLDDWMYELVDVDFAYSFLAIGFHWPFHFYLDKIYPLLSKDAILIFGIRGLEKREWIYNQLLNIFCHNNLITRRDSIRRSLMR